MSNLNLWGSFAIAPPGGGGSFGSSGRSIDIEDMSSIFDLDLELLPSGDGGGNGGKSPGGYHGG